MINTILFDLDGTLLPIDTDTFIQEYFSRLTHKFKNVIEPKLLYTHLMASTKEMIRNNDPNKTNQEVFMEEFFSRINININKIMPMFEEFYLNEFKQLKDNIESSEISSAILFEAKNKGFDLVIATNPLFPEIAIMERLNWIDGSNIDYKLITSYENMHFCKPNLSYYNEILQIIKKNPNDCLMVG